MAAIPKWLPYKMAAIQDGCHTKWLPFKMAAIQNGCHSKWLPFKMAAIQDGCHLRLAAIHDFHIVHNPLRSDLTNLNFRRHESHFIEMYRT